MTKNTKASKTTTETVKKPVYVDVLATSITNAYPLNNGGYGVRCTLNNGKIIFAKSNKEADRDIRRGTQLLLSSTKNDGYDTPMYYVQ